MRSAERPNQWLHTDCYRNGPLPPPSPLPMRARSYQVPAPPERRKRPPFSFIPRQNSNWHSAELGWPDATTADYCRDSATRSPPLNKESFTGVWQDNLSNGRCKQERKASKSPQIYETDSFIADLTTDWSPIASVPSATKTRSQTISPKRVQKREKSTDYLYAFREGVVKEEEVEHRLFNRTADKCIQVFLEAAVSLRFSIFS